MPEPITRRQYPTAPRSVARARMDSLTFLHTCGIDREAGFASDLTLVVSELMTNAAEASVALPDRPPITRP